MNGAAASLCMAFRVTCGNAPPMVPSDWRQKDDAMKGRRQQQPLLLRGQRVIAKVATVPCNPEAHSLWSTRHGALRAKKSTVCKKAKTSSRRGEGRRFHGVKRAVNPAKGRSKPARPPSLALAKSHRIAENQLRIHGPMPVRLFDCQCVCLAVQRTLEPVAAWSLKLKWRFRHHLLRQ